MRKFDKTSLLGQFFLQQQGLRKITRRHWTFDVTFQRKKKKERDYCLLKSQTPSCCIMDPSKSASAPPQERTGEKSSMGQSPPPPYFDSPNQGYPQPGPGYPPQGQVSATESSSQIKTVSTKNVDFGTVCVFSPVTLLK